MKRPLVSVVTPVYNTEKYLKECIESVLAQTYRNWEYVIVDNRSTDASGEIAAQFARRESRIRVVENSEFLPQMPNWNRAMRQISPESRYCKVVHADDWLFPECIERMVAAAEEHPTAGLVGAYRLDETRVNLDGLPWPSSLVPGREICRWTLLEDAYVFGSPTSTMISSDLVRSRDPFYDENAIHADKAICFEILRDRDFAFVHQVLTFTRRHNETTTTFIRRFNTYRSGRLEILLKYGPEFLNSDEYRRRLLRMISGYHDFLARSVLEGRDREFLAYHRSVLGKFGIAVQPIRFLKSFLGELSNVRDCWRRIRNRRRTKSDSEAPFDRSFESTILGAGAGNKP